MVTKGDNTASITSSGGRAQATLPVPCLVRELSSTSVLVVDSTWVVMLGSKIALVGCGCADDARVVADAAADVGKYVCAAELEM